MAVCGRCWICGEKFDCGQGWECEDCAPEGGGPVWTDHKTHPAHERPEKICRNCVVLIDKGVVRALVNAFREVVDANQ